MKGGEIKGSLKVTRERENTPEHKIPKIQQCVCSS